jgi:retinol dehydrogenase-14
VTLEGRSVVVTGASSGIGEAGAVELARRGALVVPVGRDPERLEVVAGRIAEAGGPPTRPERADFASLAQVRALAERLRESHERIDVLVNNAGLRTDKRVVSEDGLELTFQVNHLAPFLLTNLLLDRIRAAAPGRVVSTSSDSHARGEIVLDDLGSERNWSSPQSYANSKLANLLFMRELARRMPAEELVANCFDPGVTRTRIQRDAPSRRPLTRVVSRVFFHTPEKVAPQLVHLAEAEETERISGGYFERGKLAAAAPRADDVELAQELWRVSCDLTGLAAE